MFYRSAGLPLFPGKVVREFTFDPQSGALPSWLSATGASPILTYGSTADRGALRLQTKVAAPASGDQAGINTSNIDPTKYSEVGFFLSGLLADTSAANGLTLGFQWSNGASTGFYYQNNHSNSAVSMRIYPAAANDTMRWQLVANGQGTRSKDVGFVMRRNGDLFICAGDPYEGAGVVAYAAGTYPTTPQPIQFYVITRTAAQRYAEFTKVKLRLVGN